MVEDRSRFGARMEFEPTSPRASRVGERPAPETTGGSIPGGIAFGQVELADESGAMVLDFQEGSVLRRGFVDAERSHYTQGGRALEGADESGVAVEEVGPGGPRRHLPGVEEEAA